MGFDIQPKRDPVFRKTLTARDREYLKHCKTCPVVHLCGGWSIWDDSRFCRGPGDVCFGGSWVDKKGKTQVGCRAICPRCPEKVESATRWLGEKHYRTENGVLIPDLDIVGKHPWKPWEFEWPDVGFQINAHVSGESQALYVVSFKHLYYANRRSWSPQKNLRERFEVPDESKLAITFTTHDLPLDEVAQNLPFFAKEVAKFEGVDFVFMPNFSLYDNYPRLDNLFQTKRKWIALDHLQDVGVKVVPDIAFVTSVDFKNQVQWIKDNRCTMMLTNLQVQAVTPGTKEWQAVIHSLKAVQDRCGWPVQLIVNGAVGGERARTMLEGYPHVTFIDTKSYRLAEYHKDINGVVNKAIPPKELFHRNCEQRIELIQDLKNRVEMPVAR